MKPVIALTLGDPAGIGPEVVARTLPLALQQCRPIVFGHWPSLREAIDAAHIRIDVQMRATPIASDENVVTVVPCDGPDTPIIEPGRASAVAQWQCLEAAVDAVMQGRAAGLVTAPVSKTAISSVHPGFIGHTEHLARRAGLADDAVTMVFASDRLSVGLVTTHLPIRRVADEVTSERLARTVRHVHAAASSFGRHVEPRIAVAGLNPHAGEGGLIGREEMDVIAPVIASLRDEGFAVVGPLSAEAVMRDALAGRYDGVVACYHDQALVALKLAGVGESANVTMGLPFIRTSPDHGVAYDIARKGLADSSGMARAMELAGRWVTSSA
ncbi:MAG: 4-hydroxythreonine-4-phosphate dehydrogenase PdxA [Myxococcota bacterium]|jgi:4-hydroxythreonine-4-phosphate dehydrogenase|nr:4-hydroxythreonine-4-phosphate dehydrogenase PdxA [Myxococcota bacterium]